MRYSNAVTTALSAHSQRPDAGRRGRRGRNWAGFALPGVGWLVAFFVLPVYAVFAVAFGQVDPFLRTTVPAWNPLDWDATAMGRVLDRVFGGDLGHVFVRTFSFVALALVGCILVGYPIAYYVARLASRSLGIDLSEVHRCSLAVEVLRRHWLGLSPRPFAWFLDRKYQR